MPNLIVLSQTVRAVFKEYLPEKYDPPRPAFQGHSRSSEPTRINPPHMTSY